jgi:hypothetical protein
MRRPLILTATLAVAAAAASPALSSGGEPFPPGPQCHGQTVAFTAQLADGLAHITDPTQMREFQERIRADCELVPG